MNRIVRDNYPVAQLPEDLQCELRGVSEVRVVIEVAEENATETGAKPPVVEKRPFSRFRHFAQKNFDSAQDVVDHVRALRDEWDEREVFHERLRSGS